MIKHLRLRFTKPKNSWMTNIIIIWLLSLRKINNRMIFGWRSSEIFSLLLLLLNVVGWFRLPKNNILRHQQPGSYHESTKSILLELGIAFLFFHWLDIKLNQFLQFLNLILMFSLVWNLSLGCQDVSGTLRSRSRRTHHTRTFILIDFKDPNHILKRLYLLNCPSLEFQGHLYVWHWNLGLDIFLTLSFFRLHVYLLYFFYIICLNSSIVDNHRRCYAFWEFFL